VAAEALDGEKLAVDIEHEYIGVLELYAAPISRREFVAARDADPVSHGERALVQTYL
jgi:hypothetical protein